MKTFIFLLCLLFVVSCNKNSSCNCPDSSVNTGCDDETSTGADLDVTDETNNEAANNADAEKLIADEVTDISINDIDTDKLITDTENKPESETSKDGYEVDEAGGSKNAPKTDGITQAPKNPLIEMAIKNGIILKKATVVKKNVSKLNLSILNILHF